MIDAIKNKNLEVIKTLLERGDINCQKIIWNGLILQSLNE